MTNIRSVRTLWITRKGEDFPPELIEAWDDYSIEENYEGWEAAVQRALDSLGDDLKSWRFIDVLLNGDLIQGAFEATTIQATIHTP